MLTDEHHELLSSAVRLAWDRLTGDLPARAEILEQAAGPAATALADEFLTAMNTYNTPSGQVRVVLDGVRVPPHHYSTNRSLKIAHFDVVDRAIVNRYFDQGATVMMDDAQTAIPALDRLCSALTAHSGVPTAGTVFASPPYAEGFALHQDAEDVVIVQLAGAKSWTVFPPLARRSSSMLKEAECDKPVIETQLRAGDILVLPKGSPHKTASNSESGSVHLTIGCYPVTLRELLIKLVECGSDPRLDEPAPDARQAVAEFVRSWTASTVETEDWSGLADDMRSRLRGDSEDFRMPSSESAASGGTYRIVRRVTELTRLFLAAQLGRRDDPRLEAIIAGLSTREPGETFSYQQFAGSADRLVAQEVLHEMLRMRFINHVWDLEGVQ